MIRCNKCDEEKDDESFSWKETGKRRSKTCKQCKRLYNKEHYRTHSDYYKTSSKKHQGGTKAKHKKFLEEYLATKVCVDCGESRTPILQFDHVRGEKLFNIKNLSGSRKRSKDGKSYHSLAEIKAEIEKCEIRCANCHLMRHHLERQ